MPRKTPHKALALTQIKSEPIEVAHSTINASESNGKSPQLITRSKKCSALCLHVLKLSLLQNSRHGKSNEEDSRRKCDLIYTSISATVIQNMWAGVHSRS